MQSAGSIAAQHEDNRPGRGSSYWLNLAAAGLLLFYALYIAWQLIMRMMCSQIGVDYCEYLSAGMVANAHGYAAMYDLRLLERAQRILLPPQPGHRPSRSCHSYICQSSSCPFSYSPC